MDGVLLAQIGVVVAVLVIVWLLPVRAGDRERLARLGLRLGLSAPEPPSPSGRPLERIAADAMRLRAALRDAPPEMPVARRRGWLAAYDDVLVAACHALEVPQRLESLPEGTERVLERERVERALVRVGLLDA